MTDETYDHEQAWYPEPTGKAIYLSGAVNPPLLAAVAERDDIGMLIQPGTSASIRQHIGAFEYYAADNGCFAKGDDFDAEAWIAWVATLPRETCLFVVAPDVVGDAAATWARSEPWLARIKDLGFPAALVAQDGIEDTEIEWDAFDCLFIGGSTEWKLSDAVVELVAEAKRRGKWTHVGRVNSWKRMSWVSQVCEADSADGTYLAFGPMKNLPKLRSWMDRIAA